MHFEGQFAPLAADTLCHDKSESLEKIDHLDGAQGGVEPFVAGLGPGPLDGLFHGVGGQDPENHGQPRFESDRGDPLGNLGADVIEMRRRRRE